MPDESSAEVRGLDTVGGIPRKAAITSEEIRQALADPLARVVNGIRSVIERCDAELVGDLTETGMLLTGGSAQLRGLPAFLEARLGIPVRVDLAPTTTVIRGTSPLPGPSPRSGGGVSCGRALRSPDAWEP